MESFYTAYPLIQQLYGVDIQTDDFEEIGLIAWNHIGNRISKLYKYKVKPSKDQMGQYYVDLPCNCDIIEAITYGWEDWNYTSNTKINGDYNSQFTENYIEGRKILTSPLYLSGKFVKYEQVGHTIYLDNSSTIFILYKGVVLDDEGLPYITDKEALAIATYCAMIKMRKEGFVLRNSAIIQQSQLLYQDWLKLCSAARVPQYVNQNEMNEILDVNSNWGRKVFNKSYKPVR